MIKGIDVSSYQSSTYDTTGLSFVIVKRTEGRSYVNPKASAQVAHGRRAGLVVGHYHYPHIHDGAVADADYFLSKLGSDLKAGDLIVLDWEWYGQSGVTKDQANAYKAAWISRVKKALPGHKVGLYSDPSNWRNVDRDSNYGDFLWIATGGKPAGSPGIKDPWTFHQYSTAGGIDHDVAKFDTKAELIEWAGGKPVKPAPKPEPHYAPFPGDKYFFYGRTSKLVTEVGKALVRAGYKGYKIGPGPVFGPADRKGIKWFQNQHAELKGDADGHFGPVTWRLLKVGAPK